MTPITLPDPPLYFSLERFVMVEISWIVRSVFYFKISIPFPDESSEMFFLLSICVFFHWGFHCDGAWRVPLTCLSWLPSKLVCGPLLFHQAPFPHPSIIDEFNSNWGKLFLGIWQVTVYKRVTAEVIGIASKKHFKCRHVYKQSFPWKWCNDQ